MRPYQSRIHHPRRRRRIAGIDQLDKLLGDFVGAYQARDRARLATITQLSPARQLFVDQLFTNFLDIELQLIDFQIDETTAKVKFKMIRLLKTNGDELIPLTKMELRRCRHPSR